MQPTEPPTAGRYPRIIYETQDAHNHFHPQKIARYSLWNQARTANVAPGQKVGFCLEDTQRREDHGPDRRGLHQLQLPPPAEPLARRA